MTWKTRLKTIFKTARCVMLAQLLTVGLSAVQAQEITAINFDGEVLGKVIPDGKVVGADNKLIGNVTADSLIVSFDGKLIGGVIPQGVAIGSDARPLGKVNNDGSVRSASGQVLGRVLPNGLVVDDFFNIVGAVVFPGLVYSDEGATVGRITGDGLYTNLQGQQIGVVTPDGYAYRRVGNDYLLEGRLISSKMVVSLQGEFIGSVSPGGQVSDFNSQIIGKIKANGFVYDDEDRIVGKIVKTGYAFDNSGYYLGFVSYNGEVVDGGNTVGRLRADGKIADLTGKIIGYSIDFAAAATDLKGKYIGRVLPDGNLARAKTISALVGARGVVFGADGGTMGQLAATGPVFDYKGALRGHALPGGSVISLNGTPLGYVVGSAAYDLSGRMLGRVSRGKMVFSTAGDVLGVSGIGSRMTADSKQLLVSPLGYVFNQDGDFSGEARTIAPLYNPAGANVSMIGLNGRAVNERGLDEGYVTGGGYLINQQNKLTAKAIDDFYAVSKEAKSLGSLNADNLILDTSLRIIAKILPDNSVVETDRSVSNNYQPKTGQAYAEDIAVDFTGNFVGYTDILGNVNNLSGAKVGHVAERGLVIDNNGIVNGFVVPYRAMLNESCEVIGVVTPRGDVQNFRGVYLGRVLANGQVLSDSGSILGFLAPSAPVVGTDGSVSGVVGADGKVLDMEKNSLGCISRSGLLRNADGLVIGGALKSGAAMAFNGDVLGYSSIDGGIVGANNQIVGYQQPDGNVNSSAGIPVGAMMEYKVAFNLDNRFMGRVLSDGTVVGDKFKNVGRVNFEGYVVSGGQKVGYALYDFYVYDANDNAIGYINRNGDVVSFINQSLGRVERGFLLDKEQNVIGRGNRDYNIREKTQLVIGRLLFNGDVADAAGNIVGKLAKAGEIKDKNEQTIAQASPLQYYSKITAQPKRKMVFDKDGNFIGYLDENGNVVDADGNIIGTLDKDGNVVDKDGNIIGSNAKGKAVYDKDGNVIGHLDEDGNVVDANGKIIGKVAENGDVVDANGNVIGGIGSNWYEKAPARSEPAAKDEDVSPALKLLESKQYRKSLGIALTPDGEYLGDILEDKTVIDADGNYLGRLMPDGLVIDDDGTLIGVEEVKKPDTSGMFVPAGTFGDGGAYGTGTGPAGNLGPGGGYGPGERYDPARQAALNAAMAERRKNITVGKISNGMRKEAFDGMQKDWEEQGIGKVISSWRVDLSEMIFADKPIPAVIARPIDSNNPAPITAFVERNVYAEEGRNVIIPAGSRLMGTLGGLTASAEATSESARVQISWERLIRPDGSLFVFQGLTADAQGRAGALGYVDQQLFKKYTLPVLTTSLTSATSYFMAPSDNESDNETPRQQAANDARQNFLNEMSNIFDEILADKSSIKPMTYIPAGTRIIVFPNTDLWLRTLERDQDSSLQLEKPQVFIDDGEKAAEKAKFDAESTKKTVSTAGAGGDVVYDASADVESAKAPAPLVSSPKQNKPAGAVPGYIAPPPPPSSSSGTTASTPQTGTGSGTSSSNNSVPALF
ncbi:MAG: hypothetical protein IJ482_00745 [Alphaproteobacteria bacterium]|nr:hypothetical protein [Alphaproteobacteria bacterium]